MYCIKCGYDLRATPPGDYGLVFCPECGRGCDPRVPGTYNDLPPEAMIQGGTIAAVIIVGAAIVVGAVILRAFEVINF